MNYREDNTTNNSLVYGFLFEQTNVFYAFETYEQYQEFLSWLERETPNRSQATSDSLMSQDEMVCNFNRATEKIMEVFEDPVFQGEDDKMELEEIDF